MKAPPSKPAGKAHTQRRAFAAPSARKAVGGKTAKPENPFDKFANTKKKHEVLNRRVKGEDRNMGRAREKAIDERKTKLLKDYQSNKKSNTILDKRFGESDPTMSLEERMFMRFQKEKVKHVRNSSAFNLDAGDTEVLTHKGQVLGNSNLEDNDWVSSDDEEKAGGLNKQVVDSLHFGGGLQRRQNAAAEEMPGKGRLDALQEIVMKSKLQKMQKKEAKEEQEEERTKLDKAYQDLFSSSLLDFSSGGKADRKTSRRDESAMGSGKEDLDDYDLALKEMTYEAKLPASERTKSAEEIALAEQKRIEELEEARIKRMKQANSTDKRAKDETEGAEDSNGKQSSKRKHRTDDEIEDESFGVANKLKKAMGRDRAAERAAMKEETTAAAYNEYIMQDEEYEDSSEGEGEDDDEGSEEGSEEGSDEDDDMDGDEEGDEEVASGDDEDMGSEDEDAADADSDANSEEEDDGEDADSEEEKPAVVPAKSAKKGVAFGSDVKPEKQSAKATSAPKTAAKVSKASEQPEDEVNIEMPHKIDCPPDMETFDELIDQYVLDPLRDMSALIDRIIAWNNVHLPGAEGAENRNLMHNFLDILLKHFLRVGDSLATVPAEGQESTMKQLDYLSGVIFKLSTDVGEATCAALWGRTIKILHAQLQKRLRDYAQGEREVSCWPSLGRILLMQLIGRVFSVTDLKNDVVGPAALLLCQSLSQCPVSTPADVAAGLLTCSVLLTYNAETKRYVPEVVAFIHTVLSLYVPNVGDASSVRLSHNFQGTFNLPTLAKLRELLSSGDASTSYKMRWSYFSVKKGAADSAAVAGAVLTLAYSTLSAVVNLYSGSSALPEILSPVIETLRSLRPQSKPFVMPVALQQLHLQVLERVITVSNATKKSRQPLQWRKSVTSSIEMKNPRFQLDYTFKKDIDPDQDRAKVKQLTRQLKREQKAAMRELRRDSDFIDQERYREQQEAKEHRRAERVKNFGFMEEQQATINLQVRKGGGLMVGGGSGVVKKARVKRL